MLECEVELVLFSVSRRESHRKGHVGHQSKEGREGGSTAVSERERESSKASDAAARPRQNRSLVTIKVGVRTQAAEVHDGSLEYICISFKLA